MIIWLNGPFGGGKTQTAFELHRRLAGSAVCDPERIGFGLQRTLPPDARLDFQDLESWRRGTVEVLARADELHPGPIIAPMTVIEDGYFAETVGELRARGHDLRHFALLADREVILRRLRERVIGRTLAALAQHKLLARESFAVRKLDRCLAQLVRPEFAAQLWTDDCPVDRVAEQVAAACGLALAPATPGRVRNRLRRAGVGLRHVRLP